MSSPFVAPLAFLGAVVLAGAPSGAPSSGGAAPAADVAVVRLDVTVPPNAEGRVFVPASSPGSVTETLGGAAVTLVGVEGGRVVYDVGSGRYRFRVEARGNRLSFEPAAPFRPPTIALAKAAAAKLR